MWSISKRIFENYRLIEIAEFAEIASAIEIMVLPVNPNFEKVQTNYDTDKLIIHDMVSHNPYSRVKTVATSTRRRRLDCTTVLTIVFDFTTPLITTSTDSPLTSHLKIIAYSMMVMWNLY